MSFEDNQAPLFQWEEAKTVASALSVGGTMMVGAGVYVGIDTPLGAGLVVAGRSVDLIDGKVARAMGDDSPTGAAIDGGSDKLEILMMLGAGHVSGATPPIVSAGFIAEHSVNAAVNVSAKLDRSKPEPKPSKEGKLFMVASSASLALYPAGKMLKDKAAQNKVQGKPYRKLQAAGTAVRALAHINAGGGLGILGPLAGAGYLKRSTRAQ